MKPDYCPLANEPCQALCDVPCSARRLNISSLNQWISLTDEEIKDIVREAAKGSAIKRDGLTSHRIARAIETKLREKNT